MKDRFLVKEIHPHWGTSKYTFDEEPAAIAKYEELVAKGGWNPAKIYLMDLEAEILMRKNTTD